MNDCWSWAEFYELLWEYPELGFAEISHVGGVGKGSAGCTESTCNGVYRCVGCNKLCGWCYGASDDMPNHCDDCWSEHHKEAS